MTSSPPHVYREVDIGAVGTRGCGETIHEPCVFAAQKFYNLMKCAEKFYWGHAGECDFFLCH